MSTDINHFPQIRQKVLNKSASPVAPNQGLSDVSSSAGTNYSHNFIDDSSFTSQDSQSPVFRSKSTTAKPILPKTIGLSQQQTLANSNDMSFETTSFADFTDINSSRPEDSFFDTSTDSLYASPKWDYKQGLDQRISDSATPLSSKRLLPYANMARNNHLLNQDRLMSDINKQFPLPSKSDIIVPTYQTETATAQVSPNLLNGKRRAKNNLINKTVDDQPNLIDLDSPEKNFPDANNKPQSNQNNLMDEDIASSRENSYSPEISPSLTRISTKIQRTASRTSSHTNESNADQNNQVQPITTLLPEKVQKNASNLDTEEAISKNDEPTEGSNEKPVSTTPVNDPPPELLNKPFWIPSPSTSTNKDTETPNKPVNNNEEPQSNNTNAETEPSKPNRTSSAGHTPYKPIRSQTGNTSVTLDLQSFEEPSDEESTPEPPELLTTIIVNDMDNIAEESDDVDEPELSFETRQTLNLSGGERNREISSNDNVIDKSFNVTLDTSFNSSRQQLENEASRSHNEDNYNNSYAPYSFIPNTMHDSRFLPVDSPMPQSMNRSRINRSFNAADYNEDAYNTTFNRVLTNSYTDSPISNSQYTDFPVTASFNNRNAYYSQEEPSMDLINSVPPKRRTENENPLGKPPGRRSLVPIEVLTQEDYDDYDYDNDDNEYYEPVDDSPIPQGSVIRQRRRSSFSHLKSYHTYIRTSDEDLFRKPQDNEDILNEETNDNAQENEDERETEQKSEEDSFRSDEEENNSFNNNDDDGGEAEDNDSEQPSDQDRDEVPDDSNNSENETDDGEEDEPEEDSNQQSEEEDKETVQEPLKQKEEVEITEQVQQEREKVPIQQENLEESSREIENSGQQSSTITESSSQISTLPEQKSETRRSARQIMMRNKQTKPQTNEVQKTVTNTKHVKSTKPETPQKKATGVKRKRKSSIQHEPKQKTKHIPENEEEDIHRSKEPRVSRSSVSKPKNVWTEEQWKRLAEMVSMYDPPLNYEEPEPSATESTDGIEQIKRTFSELWNQSKRIFSGKKDFRNSKFITISIENQPSSSSNNSPIADYLQSHRNLPLPRVPAEIILEFPTTPPLELSKRIASLYAQGIV